MILIIVKIDIYHHGKAIKGNFSFSFQYGLRYNNLI